MSLLRADGGAKRRLVAIALVAALGSCAVPVGPVLGADSHALGYLVYTDSLPVGPALDATFHVIVPDGATVLSATLDLWGRVGEIPVATETTTAGDHTHALEGAGVHDHALSLSGLHDHTVPDGGSHAHPASVMPASLTLDPAKMSVTLPSHTHLFMGNIVSGYDFAAVTSAPHNHTVLAHGHAATVPASGLHTHLTDTAGDHNHTASTSGGHSHLASAAGTHAHSLEPGSGATGTTRPSDVVVSVTMGQSTISLTSTFGSPVQDWRTSADLTALVPQGETLVTMTSATSGTIEYMLVVAIDKRYAVLAGRDVVGPDAALEVPIYATSDPLSTTAYLWGGAVPTVVSTVEQAGAHEHVTDESGAHTHVTDPAGAHNHTTTGGNHTHSSEVSSDSVTVSAATPDWNLILHSHDLTWQGPNIASLGSYGYGTVFSADHQHATVAHGHTVTVEDSGPHAHSIGTSGEHDHTTVAADLHSHAVGTAGDHSHAVGFSPEAATAPGPAGVRAALDGADITDANGGPWSLAAATVMLQLTGAPLAGSHLLNLTATGDGEVEWVVLMELPTTQVIVQLRSTGDVSGHVPVPQKLVGVDARLYASPYVMPLSPSLSGSGEHGHVSSQDGAHAHALSQAGGHNHTLQAAPHAHTINLEDSSFNVSSTTATVDFGSHQHNANVGSAATSPARLSGQYGIHNHLTDAHTHELNWTSLGVHAHPVNVTGDHGHLLETAGAHAHTLTGGDHTHTATAGVHWEQAYPSPSDLTVTIGAASVSGIHPGQEGRWWGAAPIDAASVGAGPVEPVTVSSATPGTATIIVVMAMDTTPPTFELVSSPAWVQPGVPFHVSVATSEDLDNATVNVTVGPAVTLGRSFDLPTRTLDITCAFPEGTVDGLYDAFVSGSDLMGNPASVMVGRIGVDGTPPTAMVTVGSPKVAGEGFLWAASRTPVDLAAVDAGSGPGTVEYAFRDSGPWTTWDPSDRTVLAGLPEGDAVLFARATDAAGNVGSPAQEQLRIDDTPARVTVTITPSAPAERPLDRWAGPASVVSMALDDGLGVGALEAQYLLSDGIEPSVWRVFDRPFLVPSSATGTPPRFTLTWRGVDRLGNTGTDLGNSTTVGLDIEAPKAAPTRDLVVPPIAARTPVRVEGVVSTDAIVIRYRAGNGVVSSAPVGQGGAVSIFLDLSEGPNAVLYLLEDAVGNASPWTYAGTVVLDTKAPTMLSSTPKDGDSGVRPGTVTVRMDMSEAIRAVSVSATVGGKAQNASYAMRGDGTSLDITISEEVPGGTPIEVSATFTDLTGNAGSAKVTFTTGKASAGAGGGVVGNFVWGLVIGLVLGAVLIYLILSRRRGVDGAATGGQRRRVGEVELRPGMGILSPEEDKESWGGAEEGDAGAARGGGAEGEGEDAEKDEDDHEGPEDDDDDEDDDGDSRPEERTLKEPDSPPPNRATGQDDPGPEEEELSKEIDELLGGVRSPPGSEKGVAGFDEHLPDPQEETVDPGAR